MFWFRPSLTDLIMSGLLRSPRRKNTFLSQALNTLKKRCVDSASSVRFLIMGYSQDFLMVFQSDSSSLGSCRLHSSAVLFGRELPSELLISSTRLSRWRRSHYSVHWTRPEFHKCVDKHAITGTHLISAAIPTRPKWFPWRSFFFFFLLWVTIK